MTKINLPTDNSTQASAVLALLARLWATEVDADVLKALRDPAMTKAWQNAGGQLPGGSAAPHPELLENLEVDYCQLLIGPKNHVSPIQSIWDQSRFNGKASESMSSYVQMIDGFQPCHEMRDHIAVQLQFASVLFGMAEQTKKKLIQGLIQAFSRDHLEWSAPFFQRIEHQAQTDFYQSAAKVSRQFLFGNS